MSHSLCVDGQFQTFTSAQTNPTPNTHELLSRIQYRNRGNWCGSRVVPVFYCVVLVCKYYLGYNCSIEMGEFGVAQVWFQHYEKGYFDSFKTAQTTTLDPHPFTPTLTPPYPCQLCLKKMRRFVFGDLIDHTKTKLTWHKFPLLPYLILDDNSVIRWRLLDGAAAVEHAVAGAE